MKRGFPVAQQIIGIFSEAAFTPVENNIFRYYRIVADPWIGKSRLVLRFSAERRILGFSDDYRAFKQLVIAQAFVFVFRQGQYNV